MSGKKMPKKKQKTYSLPLPVADKLHKYFEENKPYWEKGGIQTESQLLAAILTNGWPHMDKLLAFLKNQPEE